MVTSTRKVPSVAAAQPLPTAATLAADCAALIAELQSAQARLQLMDVANGAFQDPVKRKRGSKAAKAPAAGDPFVKELAMDSTVSRIDSIKLRARCETSWPEAPPQDSLRDGPKFPLRRSSMSDSAGSFDLPPKVVIGISLGSPSDAREATRG